MIYLDIIFTLTDAVCEEQIGSIVAESLNGVHNYYSHEH